MRAVVWLVLLFAVAVVVATTLGRNDGMVSVYWTDWRVDVSLNLFILGALATVFALAVVWRTFSLLAGLPRRAREWQALRNERAAQAALREALSEYLGGRYARSLRAAQRAQATRAVVDGDFHALARLLGAASAHRLQDRPKRDALLQAALTPGVGARGVDDGAHLLAAEWALDDGDPTRALVLLNELAPGAARRTQALRLKMRAHRQAQEPLAALRTARLLAKHQGFPQVGAASLLRSLAAEALALARDTDQLQLTWAQFEHADREDAIVAARAAAMAAGFGAHGFARDLLRPHWEQLLEVTPEERAELAQALIAASAGMGPDWLPRLESAQVRFAQEPAILAAVGCAYAERQLWGKAQRALEQASTAPGLRAATRRRVWRTLARLAREQGDEARALACEQAAAAID